MLNFLRPILYLSGMMMLIIAGFMLIPCVLELLTNGPDASAFMESAVITSFIAAILILSTNVEVRNLSVKQMFLLVCTVWLLACAVCALPLFTSSLKLSYTDAFFESVSGLTTTGSTVITGLDYKPSGILLWRSLTQWIGGIGIVGIAIVFFPFMRIGGMQLFKSESSEKGDKVVAQAKVFAASLLGVYLIISVASAISFHLAGMNWFDAINHMMAAISTGGLSTKDSSIGYYNSQPIIWAAVFSMMLGALPFTWYMRLATNGWRACADAQVRLYIKSTLFFITVMTLWLVTTDQYTFDWSLSHAALNVVSIMTTTGFVSTDYTQWGSFALMVFILLYFTGGCTGSTTGSIKIFRWSIIFSSVHQQMLKMMMPHRIIPLRFDNRVVADEVRDSVANFIILYIVIWLITAVILALCGLDFTTALTAALSSLSNTGPGMGEIVGPAGTFAPLNDGAKWVCSAAMLLGRLELFALLMIFTRAFWRD